MLLIHKVTRPICESPQGEIPCWQSIFSPGIAENSLRDMKIERYSVMIS